MPAAAADELLLRPKEAITPDPSRTMTGTITAQIVIRNRPGR